MEDDTPSQAPLDPSCTSLKDPLSNQEECEDVDLGTLGQKMADSEDEKEEGEEEEGEEEEEKEEKEEEEEEKEECSACTSPALSRHSPGNGGACGPAATQTDHASDLIQAVTSNLVVDMDIVDMRCSMREDVPSELYRNGHQLNVAQSQEVLLTASFPDRSPDLPQQCLSEQPIRCKPTSEMCLKFAHYIKSWIKDFVLLIR